jgi:hypothetical protein
MTDLVKPQRQTWENIPTRLQDLILQHVRGALKELSTQNTGVVPESTVGFQDDNEVLEAELTARKARREANRREAHPVGMTARASELLSGSLVPRARSGAELGDGYFGDSQENWFVPQEGASDSGNREGELEGPVADSEGPHDAVSTVGV